MKIVNEIEHSSLKINLNNQTPDNNFFSLELSQENSTPDLDFTTCSIDDENINIQNNSDKNLSLFSSKPLEDDGSFI